MYTLAGKDCKQTWAQGVLLQLACFFQTCPGDGYDAAAHAWSMGGMHDCKTQACLAERPCRSCFSMCCSLNWLMKAMIIFAAVIRLHELEDVS
jgi:hypothetical protein